jgi:hypothetical protein
MNSGKEPQTLIENIFKSQIWLSKDEKNSKSKKIIKMNLRNVAIQMNSVCFLEEQPFWFEIECPRKGKKGCREI